MYLIYLLLTGTRTAAAAVMCTCNGSLMYIKYAQLKEKTRDICFFFVYDYFIHIQHITVYDLRRDSLYTLL